MNDILSSLFDCAMRNSDQNTLTHDELVSYYKALETEEKLENQLQQLLDGEALYLFKLYIKNSKDADFFADSSFFRSGLVMGMKLAAFCMLQK